MRDDAMNLIAASAKKLVAMLAFSRVAFGASHSAESFDARDLERLTREIFDHVRPRSRLGRGARRLQQARRARASSIWSSSGAGALPTGGVAKVSADLQGDDELMAVECQGPRARLRPEVVEGLKGDPLGEGLGGHWVQAYYLHALLAAAGGGIDFATTEERVVLRARVPA